MSIFVKGGDFFGNPVTVRTLERLDESTFIDFYCTHAGAELEETETSIFTNRAREIVIKQKVEVCDKCPAYRLQGTSEWQDAPVGGRHE